MKVFAIASTILLLAVLALRGGQADAPEGPAGREAAERAAGALDAATPRRQTPQARADRPLMREFMGICGHTVQFKPRQYAPAFRRVRDYHSMRWDVGDDTAWPLQLPTARNKVRWDAVYGSWNKAGFDVDVSIMFHKLPASQWKDMPADARRYGLAFARSLGPESANPFVQTVEIGNEPGMFTDGEYRTLFKAMASGLRQGDRTLRIATCAVADDKSGKYHKDLAVFKDLAELYDVITVHAYAQLQGWPTWQGSYPENPELPNFLGKIRKVLRWRDRHAPGKPVWVTEFGWDCSTREPPETGTFSRWKDVTDLQQAQWLVRAMLLFSEMGLGRAYVYFFNDADEPHVHGSSGIMRNGKPKMSFHALAQMQRILGDCRFSRVVADAPGRQMIYEYVHGRDPRRRVWVAWSPTGSKREATVTVEADGLTLDAAHAMRTGPDEPAAPAVEARGGQLRIGMSESPVYLLLTARDASDNTR